ncbi:helix-turn-helix transcriptional regulator [Riemerella anatipestifer]|nr:helix-turn-helix transcriptional regulator [Riemerella anatipestifer]MDD1551423.1 helix-turn-helix transcriptional regulator [Riemerella anatipestifer]MDD1552011.1 helix-turn-helix transcriptional regulator [Riemerella anatipestifer]MDD1596515.1 helix-turn-helix transcriptional regulator [Riemerella anatipestifer]MSN81915.1 XRE family transcriptional regulator [Riemerella anatipestifer]
MINNCNLYFMSLNERISKVIAYSELTASDFADEIEVQRSSISHITSGRNKPSLDFVIKIKDRFPEIEWDWLINGEGEMLKTDKPSESDNKEQPASPLPDLFSFESNFISEEKKQIFPNPRESHKMKLDTEAESIQESQPLEKKVENSDAKKIINIEREPSSPKVKRVVLFFDNGKFESYEM